MAANTVIARLDSVDSDILESILAADSLPDVSTSDNGKALIVSGGKWVAGRITTLPAVTADDNGKVLKVVDGAWAAVLPT